MNGYIVSLLLVTDSAGRLPVFTWDRLPVFQHLADPNATSVSPFPSARTAWLATFPLVIIEHAQGQGYMYHPRPNSSRFGEYGPEPFDPSEYGGKFFEDAAEDAARAIRKINDSTIVLYYQNGNAALPFYRQVRHCGTSRLGTSHGGIHETFLK